MLAGIGLHEALHRAYQLVQQGRQVSVSIIYGLLERCINEGNLLIGKHVHYLILRCGYESNGFLAAHLIRMFAACGKLGEADQVFVKVQHPSVYIWNAIIWAQLKFGNDDKALALYEQLNASELIPDAHIFVSVLKGCSDFVSLLLVHAHLIESGHDSNVHVCTTLCDMYSGFGNLDESINVFSGLQGQSQTACNAMIKGYTCHGHSNKALQLFLQMQIEGIQPNHITFICILKTCSVVGDLAQGKAFHCLLFIQGFDSNVAVRNTLIHMYANCSCTDDAYRVFLSSQERDIVTWNAMIVGFVQQGHNEEAFQVFHLMQGAGAEPNEITFTGLLKTCCSGIICSESGKIVHGIIVESGIETNVYVVSSLINMYSKCGTIKDGFSVFTSLVKPDLVVWSAMITCYAQNECSQSALEAFLEMQQEGFEPNQMVFTSVLKACSDSTNLDFGKLIHGQIIECNCKFNVFISSALIDMFIKCGSTHDASYIFGKISVGNTVTWSAMIAGHAGQGQNVEALQLYSDMQENGMEPNEITFLTLLNLCSGLADHVQGMLIHIHIVEMGHESDTQVSNALVDMYANCGSLRDAFMVLERSQGQNVVTWNALLAGCAKYSDYETSLKCLNAMKCQNLRPNDVTFVSILSLCNHVGLIYEAYHHFSLMREQFDILPTYEHYACIVDLFGRAGFLKEAEDMLKTAPFSSTVVTLVSLLSHCKTYGNARLATYCCDNITAMDGDNIFDSFNMLAFDGLEFLDILEGFTSAEVTMHGI